MTELCHNEGSGSGGGEGGGGGGMKEEGEEIIGGKG